eukprot:PhM_4_TR10040/c2_g1_i6/m.99238
MTNVSPLLIVVLAALVAVTNAQQCTGAHDDALTDFVDSLRLSSVFVKTNTDADTAAAVAATPTTRVGIAEFLDPTTMATGVVQYPIGMTTLCFAMGSGHPSPIVNVTTVAAYVAGTASRIANQTGPVRVYLPPQGTGAAHALLSSLKALGAQGGFDAATAYPATTHAASPSFTPVFFTSIAQVQAGLAADPYAVAVVSALQARKLRLRCASITLPPTSEGCSKTVSPTLGAAALSQLDIDVQSLQLSFAVKEVSVYPLVGPIVVLVPRDLATRAPCTGNWSTPDAVVSYVESLVTAQDVRTLLLRFGAVGLGDSALYSARVKLHDDFVTAGSTRIVAGGSSAIMPVLHAQATAWYAVAPIDFLDYPGGGSGAGLSHQRDGTWVMSGSDIPLGTTEWDARPTLRQVPGVALSVSLIHNVPGIDDLVLPVCVVNDLYRGVITHWDDERIQAVNTLTTLPHVPVTVVVRNSKSGTTEIFLSGLALLDKECRGDASVAQVSGLWPYDNTVTKASSGSLPDVVKATPGALSYITTPSDGTSKTASLSSPKFGLTGPSRSDVLLGLINSDVNASTLELSLRSEDAAYPFVGVSYFVYDSERPGNCTALKRALEFVKWMLTSQSAIDVVNTLRYIPVPEKVAEQALAQISQAMCGGAMLFPVPEVASSGSTSSIFYVVYALGGALVLACGAFFVFNRMKSAAANKFAPKKAPLCLLFTDIDGGADLWERYPDLMPTAVEVYYSTLRRVVTEYNAYEVKTVGDVVMMASSNILDGVLMGMDMQLALLDADWPEGFDVETAMGDEIDCTPGLWRGLRIKVGVHHAEVVRPQFDRVHHRYDYYGHDVNVTARVEANCKGGQVLVTAETLEVLKNHPDFATLIEGAVNIRCYAKNVELKGVAEPVTLYCILPLDLAARWFPGEEPRNMDIASEVPSTAVGAEGGDLTRAIVMAIFDKLPADKAKKLIKQYANAYDMPTNVPFRRLTAKVIAKISEKAPALPSGGHHGLDRRSDSAQSRQQLHQGGRDSPESTSSGQYGNLTTSGSAGLYILPGIPEADAQSPQARVIES